MTANQLRRLYIDFFVKKNGHKEIRGSSLIPENDPTVLFTTAGMHPLVPFLMGERHPSGTRLVDAQKCIRTDDIEEVGDKSHLTFFEMLGNWSLGDYFKEGAIKMSFEFLTSSDGGLGLPLSKLAFTCFEGDSDAPKDEESFGIWHSLGVPAERISFLPKKDNWWGPAGKTGPCGPDTEMFYWTGSEPAPEKHDPSDKRWVEIWNDVFMQYNKQEDGTFVPLKQQNVDTGMGLERVLGILSGVDSPFETELFVDVIAEIRTLAGYGKTDEKKMISERIIADHLRSATFILGDPCAVTPSNTDQGYILRRLIRRAIRHGRELGIEMEFARKLAGIIVKNYGDFYKELASNEERIYEEMSKEEIQFGKTLNKGLHVFHAKTQPFNPLMVKEKGMSLLSEDFCFEMFATYGFPLEMTIEELKSLGYIRDFQERELEMNKFENYFKKHQVLSRAGAEKKFAGGLADHSEEVTRLHTATHLLHKALRTVLGTHVEQRGSNITAERLRFDFSHGAKMTDEEKAKVEGIVNDQIRAALPVSYAEMSVAEAKAKGAIGLFESKYGDVVKVYTMGDPDKGTVFSMEICGGPHVKNTGELGGFTLLKEEACATGIRRIKAQVSANVKVDKQV